MIRSGMQKRKKPSKRAYKKASTPMTGQRRGGRLGVYARYTRSFDGHKYSLMNVSASKRQLQRKAKQSRALGYLCRVVKVRGRGNSKWGLYMRVNKAGAYAWGRKVRKPLGG